MTLDMKLKIKDVNKADKINAVQAKKNKKILTMEEAWAKIGTMKNSDSDKVKLKEVLEAFNAGKVGREVGSENKSFSKAEALRIWVKLQESLRQEKLEEMVKHTPDNYILVLTEEQLDDMVETLSDEPIIPVDTETKGLQLYTPDYIVGVSFTAVNADKHYYIPLRHDEDNAPLQDALQAISLILAWKDKEFVLHNACFDMHQFANEGITIRGKIHDTQEIMKVLNENEMTYRLKDLVTRYCKLPSDTFDVLFGKDCKFNTVPLKYARYYACKDTHVTWLLFKFQMEHLKGMKSLYDYYMTVEQPLIRVVWEMEREGFIIDMVEVEKQRVMLEAKIPQLEKDLKEKIGDINFGSPLQLLPALQRYVSPKLKATGKKDLKPYKLHPVIQLLQEWKDDSKQLNGFVATMQNFIQSDGKLHGTFRQNGARTGRFSSVEPNLQQQPPDARHMFCVDANSLILGLDFSAQEPRMLTHYTQEPILVENYNKGQDLYATLASEFYGKPYAECYKKVDGSDTKERKTFKVVVLAIMYGMGAGSLGASLGISPKDAQAMLDKFKATFPNIAKFTAENTATACKLGFVTMSLVYEGVLLERKRRLPFFKGESPKSVYDTYSTNAKIQGTSAIQTKLCMIKGNALCKSLRTKDRHFALLGQVHDELLYIVPKDITREEVAQFEAIMTSTVKLDNIPSGTDAELGNCWGSMIPVRRWFEEV